MKTLPEQIFRKTLLPLVHIDEAAAKAISPNYNIKIDYADQQDHGNHRISEPVIPEHTNNLGYEGIPFEDAQSDQDALNTKDPTPRKLEPSPSSKFPARLPVASSISPTVQKSSLPTEISPPNNFQTLLLKAQAVPAVPGLPVLGDSTIQFHSEDSVETLPDTQFEFIPMPVQAVPPR